MRSILIGCGEVGGGIRDALSNNLDAIYDPGHSDYSQKPEGKFDIMIVAFGYSDRFIDHVKAYQKEFKPKATIIFSTVPIGTSRKLGAYHSPVEGRHPKLGQSIKTMDRWVGGYGDNSTAEYLVTTFLAGAGFKLKMVGKPEATEFLKMQSTSKYGINIEFARYAKAVCDDLGIDFKLVKEFDTEYNRLYEALGMPQFKRYILDAPEGPIGGHCVVPNAKLLDRQYPSLLLKEIYKPVAPELDNMIAIQRDSVVDDYMRGLYNGLVLAKALISGVDPEYLEPEAIREIKKTNKVISEVEND